jgi:putative DNA primase/helicase
MLAIALLDGDLQLRRLSVSRDDLHHKSRVLLSQLADRGFRIYCLPDALAVFLQLWDHVPRSWRADHPGWFETPAGPLGYLRPDATRHAPADAAEKVFLAGVQPSTASWAGSMDGWQTEIAKRAADNPALIFAISAALAARFCTLPASRPQASISTGRRPAENPCFCMSR